MNKVIRFIQEIVSREAARVRKFYPGSEDAVDQFLAAVPDLAEDGRVPRLVQFRWWRSTGGLEGANYELSHPDVKVLIGPGRVPDGEYVPDGAIPKVVGLDFEIVVFFWDDDADGVDVPDPWKRSTRRALDVACGARVFPA